MQQRNYGTIGQNEDIIEYINPIKQSQVYEATHKGDGSRVPFMYRSFISFSYGGKSIEDFGLLAITENNAIQRQLYADFSDNITESSVLNGQKYWSTHYNKNSLSLILFTDGITEKQLNEFKVWFKPGEYKELILAETPNRAILARISEPPRYSILPFEGHETVKMAGNDYNILTTLYKGRIDVSFVMDDPFWYSLTNIFSKGVFSNGNMTYYDSWSGPNGEVAPFDSLDAMKIIREDGVPTGVMLANVNNLDTTITQGEESISLQDTDSFLLLGDANTIGVLNDSSVIGSQIGYSAIDKGHIAYYLISTNSTGVNIPQTIDLNNPHCQYFYYAGTAPCAPKIKFDLVPSFSDVNAEENFGYLISPYNSYCPFNEELTYNTIYLEGVKRKGFRFTTPSILTAYNQAIKIFKEKWDNTNLVDLRALLRDNVKHYVVRAYAIAITNIPNCTKSIAILKMLEMFKDPGTNTYLPIKFMIDCKKGEMLATIKYKTSPTSTTFSTIEENVGDMVKSSYLTIEEKNYFDENGYIAKWSDQSEITKQYSHRIYHDIPNGLSNFSMEYKYLYL